MQDSKKEGFGGDDGTDGMKVVPVNFAKHHKEMLSHAKMILEQQPRKIAIHPRFTKLITSLRTAVAADGSLDKEATAKDDLLDSLRLALCFYEFRESLNHLS